MDYGLTLGAVQRACTEDTYNQEFLNEEGQDGGPIVQVLEVKCLPLRGQPTSYGLVISDSLYHNMAMLTRDNNHLVEDGSLQAHCIIRLQRFRRAQTTRGKMETEKETINILMITRVIVVDPGPGTQIGSPSGVHGQTSNRASASFSTSSSATCTTSTSNSSSQSSVTVDNFDFEGFKKRVDGTKDRSVSVWFNVLKFLLHSDDQRKKFLTIRLNRGEKSLIDGMISGEAKFKPYSPIVTRVLECCREGEWATDEFICRWFSILRRLQPDSLFYTRHEQEKKIILMDPQLYTMVLQLLEDFEHTTRTTQDFKVQLQHLVRKIDKQVQEHGRCNHSRATTTTTTTTTTSTTTSTTTTTTTTTTTYSTNVWVFPCNVSYTLGASLAVNLDHWAILVVDFLRKRIKLYDSGSTACRSQYALSILKPMATFVRLTHELEQEKNFSQGDWKLQVMKCSTQKTAKCGHYSLHNTLAILFRVPVRSDELDEAELVALQAWEVWTNGLYFLPGSAISEGSLQKEYESFHKLAEQNGGDHDVDVVEVESSDDGDEVESDRAPTLDIDQLDDSKKQVPFDGVLSVGFFCFPGAFFKHLNENQRAGPFDNIFSCPLMIIDCLHDDFKTFMDTDLHTNNAHNTKQKKKRSGQLGKCQHTRNTKNKWESFGGKKERT